MDGRAKNLVRMFKIWEYSKRLTSKCIRLTVRMTTKANLLVSMDPLTGALMAWVSASRRPLTVSKFLLVLSDIKYFPAARTQLSDTNGYWLLA